MVKVFHIKLSKCDVHTKIYKKKDKIGYFLVIQQKFTYLNRLQYTHSPPVLFPVSGTFQQTLRLQFSGLFHLFLTPLHIFLRIFFGPFFIDGSVFLVQFVLQSEFLFHPLHWRLHICPVLFIQPIQCQSCSLDPYIEHFKFPFLSAEFHLLISLMTV